MILLLIVGLILTVTGLLSIFNAAFDNWIERNVRVRFEPDSARRAANRVFSRYWGGTGIAMIRIVLMALYFAAALRIDILLL